jgi:copper(I)-binding protein
VSPLRRAASRAGHPVSARGIALWAVAAAACHAASHGGSAAQGAISITHAVVSAPAGPPEAPAFLVLQNRGTAADTLRAVQSSDADSVLLHTMIAGRMALASGIAIPAGERVRLAPGGYHLMLRGLRHPLAVGDTVTLDLEFAAAGNARVRAPVLRYTEAVREVQ